MECARESDGEIVRRPGEVSTARRGVVPPELLFDDKPDIRRKSNRATSNPAVTDIDENLVDVLGGSHSRRSIGDQLFCHARCSNNPGRAPFM